MTLKQALYTYLCAYADLTALVGSQVYPARQFPQGIAPPCITYLQTHERVAAGQFVRAHLQFDCWANTDVDATHVADHLRAALHAFHGEWGDLHVTSTVTNITDGPPLPTADLYRQIVEAQVYYNRPTP